MRPIAFTRGAQMSIHRHLRRDRRGERGQVLALMAGGLVAMLLFVGLVIDTGVAFQARRAAQNIVDLAAMAGTRVVAQTYLDPSLTLTSADVYAAIEESVGLNGCPDPCPWTGEYVRPTGPGVYTWTSLGPVAPSGAIPAGAQGVSLTAERDADTFFIRIIGRDRWDVAAASTAMASRLPDPPGGILIPIGVFDSDYEAGRTYELTEGYEGPGNFGWISWLGSPSAPVLAESLCDPDNPAFTFPTWFDGATGMMNSSDIRACLDGYIANQTVVYVPIWRQTNNRPGSNLQYEIVQVAAFVLTGYDQHAASVEGRFVEFYSYPSVPAGFGEPPCSATTDPDCEERMNFIGLVE
jgi:hypothetical protein